MIHERWPTELQQSFVKLLLLLLLSNLQSHDTWTECEIKFLLSENKQQWKNIFFLPRLGSRFLPRREKKLSCRSCIWGWRWTWRRTWWPCWRPLGSPSRWRSSCALGWQTCRPPCTRCGSQRLAGRNNGRSEMVLLWDCLTALNWKTLVRKFKCKCKCRNWNYFDRKFCPKTILN